MRHLFLGVHHMDKDRVIAELARGDRKTLVFCDTKRACDKVSESLQKLGARAMAIQVLPQSARERALKRFTNNELNMLVAADAAARVSTSTIAMIVHYVPPLDVKTHLHRSGRTTRRS